MKKAVVVLLTILMLFTLFQGALRESVVKAVSTPIWPMFHYNAQRTGQCPYDTSKNNGTLKWKYETGDVIYSAPAIASDGTIYVGSEDHYLYAIGSNGMLKWKFKTEGGVNSPAIDHNGTIYVGSDVNLYAINPDGTLKWKFKTDNTVASSPAIGSNGMIYVSSFDRYLYAISPDGTLKWKFKIGELVGWYQSSPAIGLDGTIYVGSWDSCLYAIYPNGTLKWKFKTDSTIVLSSPAIGLDGTIYVGSNDNYFYAINPDGTLKWKFKTDEGTSSSPAIGLDGTIYVGTLYMYEKARDNYFYAINPDGTIKWKIKAFGPIYSSPAISSDGTIYIGLGDSEFPGLSYYDDYLYAINPDHTIKWKFKTEVINGYITSSPAISSDGTIYVGSYDHYLYAIGNPSFTITASTGTGGTISPSGTISVNYGDSKTFTITPNPGYKIKDVKVDGASVGSVSTYTFMNVEADHTIEVVFEPITCTITASAGSGGTISLSGTLTISYGDSKTFTIVPNSGYKISDVKVDGASQGALSTYTFTNVTTNHTISATFEKEITQTVIILKIGDTNFTVNGETRSLDSPPVIKNSRTLLPIRAVVEALGGTVGWDANDKKVTVSLGSTTLELWIGKSIAKVNGIDTPIDSANSKVVPEIINSRTMLPLRFVTENLGCDVNWDQNTKTITITNRKG